PLSIRNDDDDHPTGSNVVILENGKALGPPHSLHSAIKEQGGGRYSHWGKSNESLVVFSTSDNSDPRTNGRKYEIVATPVLPTPLAVASAILFAAVPATIQTIDPVAIEAKGGNSFYAALTVAPEWPLLFSIRSDDNNHAAA